VDGEGVVVVLVAVAALEELLLTHEDPVADLHVDGHLVRGGSLPDGRNQAVLQGRQGFN
jgi:hypothetical protein